MSDFMIRFLICNILFCGIISILLLMKHILKNSFTCFLLPADIAPTIAPAEANNKPHIKLTQRYPIPTSTVTYPFYFS